MGRFVEHRSSLRQAATAAACVVVLIVCLLSLLCPAVARAAESENPLAVSSTAMNSSKTVRVAASPRPNNFLYVDENGDVSGYAYEYLNYVAQYTGWDYRFVSMDFGTSLQALSNDEVDLVAGLLYSDARAQVYLYAGQPIITTSCVLYCLPDADFHYDDFNGYAGMRVGIAKDTLASSIMKDYLTDNSANCEFVYYDSQAEMDTALYDGEIDAATSSLFRCAQGIKILAQHSTQEVYFATSKDNADIATGLDEAYDRIHLENPYIDEKLIQKYISPLSDNVAFTTAEQRFIDSSGPITIYLSESDAPIEYYDKTTETFEGIIPDMLDRISDNTGLTFKYASRLPYQELSEQATAGKILMIGATADEYSVTRALGVNLTSSLFNDSISMVSRGNVSFDDLANLSVAVPTESLWIRLYLARIGCTDVRTGDSWEACAKAVREGSVDCMLVNTNCVNYLLGHAEYDKLVATTVPDSSCDFSIGISDAANPLLLSIMNKGINRIGVNARDRIVTSDITSITPARTWRDVLEDNILLIAIVLIVFLATVASFAFRMARLQKRTTTLQREALRHAEAASDAKTAFLSRMSHDIRTPMNGIIGMTRIARETDDTAEKDRCLDKIDTSSQFLLGLVNDILDLSKVESGAVELHLEPYPISEFGDYLDAVIRPLCAQKNMNLIIDNHMREDIVPLMDRLRVNQIVFNLLSNAVKFTPENGTVTYHAEDTLRDDGRLAVTLVVSDTGIGMTKRFQERLFEPFSQESQRNQETTGTGLGLAIVKGTLDLMGGTIRVDSTLGKGTTFTVKADFDCVPADKVRMKTVSDVSLDALSGKRILLAEDNKLNMEIAKHLLEKANMTVTDVENGKLCLERFEDSPAGTFDMILMDIRMPIMGGYEATAAIRALKRKDAASVPIVAMSANAYEEDKEESLRAGMNAHLAKPVDPAQLYRTLASFFGDKDTGSGATENAGDTSGSASEDVG